MERKALFVITSIVISVILITCTTEKQTSKSFTLSPPMDGVDIEYSPYNIEASIGGTIELENGGSIVVPPDAFIDASGKPVTGKVKIDFREFHDAYEILLSGIPMSYDSAGVRYNFETAGMFEINGYSQNSEVYIKEGSSIQVNLASYNSGNDFGFYVLNDETGNWEFIDQGRAELNVTKTKLLDSLAAFTDKPVRPIKANGEGIYLDFNILYRQFPELKEISSVMWKYTGNSSKENPDNNRWIYDETWTRLDLVPYNSEMGQYKLSLSNNNNSFVTTVSAVLMGEDYEKALGAFQNNMSSYRQKYKERVEAEQRANFQADILRSYSINSFGIFNWDRYMKQPGVLAVKANFDFDQTISSSADIMVYLITDDNKSLVKFPRSDWSKFSFIPDSDNLLVAILPGNKVAVFTPDDFETINTNDLANQDFPSYTFKMRTIDKKIENPEDFMNIMKNV